MIRHKIIKFGVAASLCVQALAVVAEEKAVVEMPLVPVADEERKTSGWRRPVVDKESSNASAESEADASREIAPVRGSGVIIDRSIKRIETKPGVNEILYISAGHTNRIVTPFQEPTVTTMSDATITARDNVLYVGTYKQEPVTLYVTQKGTEHPSIALTLIPKKIPTQEIFLSLAEDLGAGYAGQKLVNKEAERWENKQPYIETIKKAFAAIALGDIPRGYAMHPLSKITNLVQPLCEQKGLQFDWNRAQVVHGHRMSITIGVVKNPTEHAIEVQSNPCMGWDVAAVATWPHVMLQPGQMAEIYVARKQNETERKPVARPSLLAEH
jgi:conjugal transfer pilus assembly protein TraK